MNNTILEDGVEMGLSKEQVDKLIKEDIIYPCEECNFYHITPELSYDDVDKSLSQ